MSNIQLVKSICRKLDKIKPRKNKKKHESLIYYVKDRPGHDLRYSLNSNKIFKEIKWSPKVELNKGLEFTIKWYLEILGLNFEDVILKVNQIPRLY